MAIEKNNETVVTEEDNSRPSIEGTESKISVNFLTSVSDDEIIPFIAPLSLI